MSATASPAQHMDLVSMVATRAARRSGIDYKEAVQDGYIGLLGCKDRFDESRGFTFGTFAYRAIAGAIVDGAKAREGLNVWWRRHKATLCRVRQQLRASLYREPTSREIAAALGVAVEKVWYWEMRLQIADAEQFDDGFRPPHVDDLLERMVVVKARMRCLTAREVQILALSYYDGFTLGQIAEVLGLTEDHTGVLRKNALRKLRPVAQDAAAA